MNENDIFNKAIEIVFKNEGEYSNNSNDSGGETKYGISKSAYPNLDIKDLTKDKAREIYFQDYFKKSSAHLIVDEDLAIKFFDLVVNLGQVQATKNLQRALKIFSPNIKDDGILGSLTLNAINSLNKLQSFGLLCSLKTETAYFYKSIATGKNAIFLKGWLNRLYG